MMGRTTAAQRLIGRKNFSTLDIQAAHIISSDSGITITADEDGL
jgi:hypothetical protein